MLAIKSLFLTIFIVSAFISKAQEIVNLVLVGDKGITQNAKEAKYLIAIKIYSDTLYERLEYKMDGPLIKLISYKDSAITIKSGHYAEYGNDGWIAIEGEYASNKKNGSWIIYGKNGKRKFKNKYINDQLLETINLDSLAKEDKKIANDPLEIEATYKEGERAYTQLVTNKFTESINAGRLKNSGNTRIRFLISTAGKMEDFYMSKSTDILFDEECLKIMRSIPNNWMPATQHGKPVKAFREQPITFDLR